MWELDCALWNVYLFDAYLIRADAECRSQVLLTLACLKHCVTELYGRHILEDVSILSALGTNTRYQKISLFLWYDKRYISINQIKMLSISYMQCSDTNYNKNCPVLGLQSISVHILCALFDVNLKSKAATQFVQHAQQTKEAWPS